MASMATPMNRRLRASFGPMLASPVFPMFIESYRCFLLIFSISASVSVFKSRHSYARLELEAEGKSKFVVKSVSPVGSGLQPNIKKTTARID
jgi:hypothetical protein